MREASLPPVGRLAVFTRKNRDRVFLSLFWIEGSQFPAVAWILYLVATLWFVIV